MTLPDKPDNQDIPGMEKSVSSLKKRIDELESLLREKEAGDPTLPSESLMDDTRELDEIPVLDEIIATEDDAGISNNEYPDIINKPVTNDDRVKEIINILDKQVNSDLDALMKLLKHSIMKKIKTQLLTLLSDKPDKQYTVGSDNDNSSQAENSGNGPGVDTHQ